MLSRPGGWWVEGEGECLGERAGRPDLGSGGLTGVRTRFGERGLS
jgi:hypothetical protein